MPFSSSYDDEESSDDQTTIGAMISRFRQSSPKARKTRDSLRDSADFPEFWWEKKRSTSGPRGLSIDQMIAQDIKGYTEALSPVRGASVLPSRGYESDEDRYSISSSSDDQYAASIDSDYDDMLLQSQLSPRRKKRHDSPKHDTFESTPMVNAPPPISQIAHENIRAAKNEISESLNIALDSLAMSHDIPRTEEAFHLNESCLPLPHSAGTIAQDLESALKLIGSRYSERSEPEEKEEEKASSEEEDIDEARLLVDESGAANPEEIDDILDRLDSENIKSSLRRQGTILMGSMEPLHPDSALPNVQSQIPRSSEHQVNSLKTQMKDMQQYIMKKMSEIESLERGDTCLREPFHVDDTAAATVEKPDKILSGTDHVKTIQQTLDVSMMKLRHSLDVERKEAEEKEARRKKQAEIEANVAAKARAKQEKLEKERNEELAAKKRVMGAATLLDIEATQSEVDASWRDDINDAEWDQVHWNLDDPIRVPDLPPSSDHREAINRFDALFEPERFYQQEPQYERWAPSPMQYHHYPMPPYQYEDRYQTSRPMPHHDAIRAHCSVQTDPLKQDIGINTSSVPVRTSQATAIEPTTADGQTFLSSIDNYRKLRQQRYSWLRQVTVPQG